MTRTTTSAADLASAERTLEAVRLRRSGHTFDQIADRLGYASRSGAYHAVKRHLEAVRDEAHETTAELFDLDLARTDDLYLALMASISAGDPQAVSTAVRVLERRAKMLGHDDYEKRMATAAERAVVVEQEQAMMLATALADALGSVQWLTQEQRAQIARAVAESLEKITEPSSLPEGVAGVAA